jgi:hypothetical protein
MRGAVRRLVVGVVLGGVVAFLYASTSFACIFLAGITLSAPNVQPGGSLTVNGLSFGGNPVVLHLDSVTGNVLATVTPNSKGNFTQAVTISQDVGNGPHVIVATEDAADDNGAQGTPARAAFQVGTGGPTTPAATPAGPVQVDKSAGVGTLALIGVAVACVGVFIGGLISLLASRSRHGEAVRVG